MDSSHTIAFDWDIASFDQLVHNCAQDDSILLALHYLPAGGKILEAGCGPGHVVRYLQDHGFSVEGIEINDLVVRTVNRRFPELPVKTGDVAAVPVADGHYDGLVSFGVVEHFRAGPAGPLAEHFRVLRPGGIAVISVPSHNGLRRLRDGMLALLRALLLRKPATPPPARGGSGDIPYHVHPASGEFFEYRLSPSEFKDAVKAAGFRIVASKPTHHLVGLWYDFPVRCVAARDRVFTPTPFGRVMDGLLRLLPFFHNHMHTVVAVK